MTLIETGKRAKETAGVLGILGSDKKNEGLRAAAAALLEGEEDILTANQDDVIKATINGMSAGMIDRLELTPSRIEAMADGLISVAGLDDPVGEVISMKVRPNGLTIGQKRVPMGVVGIIYEARPNVTADAFGLCFKSGNSVILKGGSDALESNKAIVRCLRAGLKNAGLPEDCVQGPSSRRAPATAISSWMRLRISRWLSILYSTPRLRGSASATPANHW